MLAALGFGSLDELMAAIVPGSIRMKGDLKLPPPRGEQEVLADLRALASRNKVFRSYLGMGYHDCHTPGVILRNVLENPGWYTAYTPYQAEISQGRMEALLNYQTLVRDLTGMELSSASLLDEATAAAEAMTMCKRVLGRKGEGREVFLVASDCHPQTISVVQTRAEPLGIEVVVTARAEMRFDERVFGVLLQTPTTDGVLCDVTALSEQAHAAGALVCVATDLLAATICKPAGAMGADMVVGSSQRFGVPMGYGGPHAAFLATKEEFARQMPGRIIGVTKDAHDRFALRMALQTREQHIRREKATSNICTAQVLLAVMASMYAVYHGPEGLAAIARRTRAMTAALATALGDAGCTVSGPFFDTVRVKPKGRTGAQVVADALAKEINLRLHADGSVGVAFDETVTEADVRDVAACFGVAGAERLDVAALAARAGELPAGLTRGTPFLEHPVFAEHRSETEMLRYIHRLEAKDLSLNRSMIALGSCTMKLNATAEMIPVTWPAFGKLHPFVPAAQAAGYREMFQRLETWLSEITGFAATSLQPNAGSQGEYAGLLVIRAYHRARGDDQRTVCLIPSSAHGTNPASAAMCGMEVVIVACDKDGNIDVADLEVKAKEHRARLSALMVTYPSTHGVFEVSIAPQPAQDLLHPAWRRRSGHGPDRRRQAPRAVPAGASRGRVGERRLRDRSGVGGAVEQRVHPADQLRLHRDDGGERSEDGHRSGDPRRQLRGAPAAGPLPGPVLRQAWPGRARVHPRVAAPQAGRCGRRGEAPDGLRVPRADAVLPGRGDADGGADRERVDGGAGSVLHRDAVDRRRDPGDRRRACRCAGQRAEERAALVRACVRGRVEARLYARGGVLPRAVAARVEVLADGEPRQRRVRRQEPRVCVPAGRSVRELITRARRAD